jgi:hypothetical protein
MPRAVALALRKDGVTWHLEAPLPRFWGIALAIELGPGPWRATWGRLIGPLSRAQSMAALGTDVGLASDAVYPWQRLCREPGRGSITSQGLYLPRARRAALGKEVGPGLTA